MINLFMILKLNKKPIDNLINYTGTGKTTTLSEIILQIFNHVESSRIIIVTQSNNAANLILQRLIDSNHVDTKQLLRITSLNYSQSKTIPENIRSYCTLISANSNDQNQNEFHNISTNHVSYVNNFRIVVSTSVAAGILIVSSETQNLFTHAVIDEAGQCSETEALIPMVLVGKTGQTIMAGDPMQMSAICFDHNARDRGYEISLLSRLLDIYNTLSNAFMVRSLIGFILLDAEINFYV